MKFAYIDFEYRPKISHNVLVCCVIYVDKKHHRFWLYENASKPLVTYINDLHEQGFIFTAFNAVAEAECFIDLGLKPLNYRWFCLRIAGIPFAHSSSDFAKWCLDQAANEKKPAFEEDKKTEIKRKVKSRSNLVSFLKYFCSIDRDIDTKKKYRKHDHFEQVLYDSGRRENPGILRRRRY